MITNGLLIAVEKKSFLIEGNCIGILEIENNICQPLSFTVYTAFKQHKVSLQTKAKFFF